MPKKERDIQNEYINKYEPWDKMRKKKENQPKTSNPAFFFTSKIAFHLVGMF